MATPVGWSPGAHRCDACGTSALSAVHLWVTVWCVCVFFFCHRSGRSPAPSVVGSAVCPSIGAPPVCSCVLHFRGRSKPSHRRRPAATEAAKTRRETRSSEPRLPGRRPDHLVRSCRPVRPRPVSPRGPAGPRSRPVERRMSPLTRRFACLPPTYGTRPTPPDLPAA